MTTHNALPDDVPARAARAYAAHREQWTFLGYSESIALAVLAEFFTIAKPRNPSQKPLNVLAVLGKSRVQAIAKDHRRGDA